MILLSLRARHNQPTLAVGSRRTRSTAAAVAVNAVWTRERVAAYTNRYGVTRPRSKGNFRTRVCGRVAPPRRACRRAHSTAVSRPSRNVVAHPSPVPIVPRSERRRRLPCFIRPESFVVAFAAVLVTASLRPDSIADARPYNRTLI